MVQKLPALGPNPAWATLPLFDRTGWKRMAFGEFAESIGERAEPKDAQDEIYVGLEHLDPQCLHIRRWGKGYGWVECGGERFFAHVKDFERGQRRPKAGEEVRFVPGTDAQGRTCAKRVAFVKAGKPGVGIGAWILLVCLLVLPLLAILWLPFPWWMGAGAMLVVSAVTYGMYAHDKQRAVANEWRLPENSLHLAELLGGWPGAFLAQRRLRHKCSKPVYQLVFWLIVLLHQAAALDVMLDHRLSKALVARIW